MVGRWRGAALPRFEAAPALGDESGRALGLRTKAAPLQSVLGVPGVSVPSQLPGPFGGCADSRHNRVAEAPGL